MERSSGIEAVTIPPSSGAPLTDAHQQELALARSQIKPIRKAAKVASFNGWTMSVAAILSAPFAIFSVVGAVMTIGLSVVAYNEFWGRRQLLRLNPAGATLLGWNQLGLLTMIVAYSTWMLWAAIAGPSPLAAELEAHPELGEALGSVEGFEDLYQSVSVAFYGVVIAVSVLVQGLTALYYFTRRQLVVAYQRDTPEWIQQLERATAG